MIETEFETIQKAWDRSDKIINAFENAISIGLPNVPDLTLGDISFSLTELCQAFWSLISIRDMISESQQDQKELLLIAIQQLHPGCPDTFVAASDFLYQVANAMEESPEKDD